MAVTSIKVSGLRELGESMRKLSSDVSGRIARAATAAGAGIIKKAAQKNAPVRTGALKGGIVVKRIPASETGLTSEHIVTVSTRSIKNYVKKSRAKRHRIEGFKSYVDLGDFFYAHFIEFGTVKMSARPFLRPAFDANKEAAVKAIRDRIAARLAKVKP